MCVEMARWHRWQLPQSILILTKGVVALACHPRTLHRRRQEDSKFQANLVYTDPVQEGETAGERREGERGGQRQMEKESKQM